jgi:hypothetical protein
VKQAALGLVFSTSKGASSTAHADRRDVEPQVREIGGICRKSLLNYPAAGWSRDCIQSRREGSDSMAKILIEARKAEVTPHSDTPPLSPSVRRHIGKSLRTHYAETLAEPVSERLEALLARLQAPKA